MSETEERIIKTEYSELMHKSYIDYAMSVIIARAIPDVRDGLKPVQRRILYDMHELGLKHDKPHRKSARIVGDTMGKYHPHGDSSIYEAMVVLAQDFKKGVPLVDGHGNFGSIEGDPPAASRYTESRLTQIAQDVYLSDLDKDVVDFVPNFDASEKEPAVLPVRLPNLLLNGSDGIAVGMTTNTPPHNLGEVADAMVAYIENPSSSTEELMAHIKGPDFPTGGIVANKDDLLSIYETGTGKIRVRGKVEIEDLNGGKKRVVITEIPFTMIGSGIGKFLSDIASLAETKQTNDIVDISNQSSKDGIRIVVDLKKDANVDRFINLLYKKTKLEDTFGVNMLAIADGRPEILGLKDILHHCVDFQYELLTRKYNTLLKKEIDKSEIQEGLIKAVDLIDVIIDVLRGSKTLKTAKACLMFGDTQDVTFKRKTSERAATKLCFTERQAQAILDMRLQKLIGLELNELKEQHEQTLVNIKHFEKILSDPQEMKDVLKSEIEDFKKKYATERKTSIENAKEAVVAPIEIAEQSLVMLMDRFGYVHTVDKAVYEKNKETLTAENISTINCVNISELHIFTNKGMMFRFKVSDIPYGRLRDKGVPIETVCGFDGTKEKAVLICDAKEFASKKLLFVTKTGLVKAVDSQEFSVTKKSIAATKLEKDELVAVVPMEDTASSVVLETTKGVFLRFPASDVPIKKKSALGAHGIKLGNKDTVKSAYVISDGADAKIIYKSRELCINRLKMSKRNETGVKQK